ncbi:hypothetical protein [uncultured Chitinophaga sp.]|uniref:hypothetical protein n=1 Tax=uncultured Chitinophaga sp. TaxID=339340 RepID=UPI0025F049BA|nr:hypothetical protein [uncultured Chitinophaga sp.]
MAKSDSILRLRGKIKGIINYSINGKFYARAAPEVVRQTLATREAARDFGTASRAARIIRHAIDQAVSTHFDGSFLNRLNKEMGVIVRDDITHPRGKRQVTTGSLQRLIGFRVNTKASIYSETDTVRCHNGHIAVTVKAPHQGLSQADKYFRFRAIAICPDFALGMCKTFVSEYVDVPAGDVHPPIELIIPTPAGKAAIVMLEVIAAGDRGLRTTMRFQATEVIAVMSARKAATVNTVYSESPAISLPADITGSLHLQQGPSPG